jgi:hypothetical protein
MRILDMGRSGLLRPISRYAVVRRLGVDDCRRSRSMTTRLCVTATRSGRLAQLARPYMRISVDIFDGETLTEELLGELRRESHNTTCSRLRPRRRRRGQA